MDNVTDVQSAVKIFFLSILLSHGVNSMSTFSCIVNSLNIYISCASDKEIVEARWRRIGRDWREIGTR